jgi:hypothetical protein
VIRMCNVTSMERRKSVDVTSVENCAKASCQAAATLDACSCDYWLHEFVRFRDNKTNV